MPQDPTREGVVPQDPTKERCAKIVKGRRCLHAVGDDDPTYGGMFPERADLGIYCGLHANREARARKRLAEREKQRAIVDAAVAHRDAIAAPYTKTWTAEATRTAEELLEAVEAYKPTAIDDEGGN